MDGQTLQRRTETAEAADVPDDPRSLVVAENVSKTYGSGAAAVDAVEDVSLSIERGTVVGLLGPNGAGKTTLLKCMLGLIVPDAGAVRIGGLDVHARPREAHRHVGAVLEGARNVYWRLTVRENLRFFAALGGLDPAAMVDRHDRLLERLDLRDRADTVVKELSRGMKQKVSIAGTLARDPAVAFLDEPTLGLDVETSRTLRSELRRLATEDDVTIVLSSHDMDVVQAVCDRAIVVNEGAVIADDDVDDLVDLFRTQRFELVLDRPLPDGLEGRVRDGLPVEDVSLEPFADRVHLTVQGAGDRFYALMGLLEDTGASLRSVRTLEPDLEDVFLELTGGES